MGVYFGEHSAYIYKKQFIHIIAPITPSKINIEPNLSSLATDDLVYLRYNINLPFAKKSSYFVDHNSRN